MEISTSQAQARVPVTILRISGVVDSSNYSEFSDVAREAIEVGGAEYLILDLSAVSYMSSAGLRSINEIFLLFRKKHPNEVSNATEKSRRLKLLGPQEMVAQTLSMSGVDTFLETHRDLQSALASF